MLQTENPHQVTTENSSEHNKNHINEIKEIFLNSGLLFSKVIQGKEKVATKYSSYFDYCHPIQGIQSHHALELLRGRREGFLRLSFKLPEEETTTIAALTKQEKAKLEKELIVNLREIAEKEAIALCVQNLRQKLMAAPVGKKIILSLDTRFRAGVKVAIIDNTGKFLDATHLNLYPPLKDWYGSIAELAKLVIKHHVELIGIGSGQAFRETLRLTNELIKMYPDLKLTKQTTHATGDSSAPISESSLAELFPFNEAFWGAVSLARQLQDPLAELIKTDPTTINLGPYQQDVRPAILKPALEAVIKDCIEKKSSLDSSPSSAFDKSTANNAGKNRNHEKTQKRTPAPPFNSAMADALAKLRTGEKA